ncbi:aldo/keto reductase [Sphingomonas elodea]|uniref:aldo/keto reductase n=1 Tax=Sphingomonas elodea TaxID=179878 RepID=UPI0002630D0B|nr:aldo/keto reductase [Sphingomonas elodea]
MPTLGTLEVSRQGFGCMGLSHTYGRAEDAESIRTIRHAIDLGITLIDTANVYGRGHNEELVGQAIAGRRHEIVLASKFGIVPQDTQGDRRVNNEIAYLRDELDGSLKRLKVDHIDLYYVHRIDPTVAIEDTIGELVRQKEAGKIGAIGLSEASAETIRRAHAVHPIAALQSELSLWTREIEAEILPTVRALGIGFVAYSPLGRGFLAGSVIDDPDDRRHHHPRFHAEALAANEQRRASLARIADRLGASIAQVSLAWVLAKGTVPIPGTRHIAHLDANWAANDLVLDPQTIEELDAAFPVGSTVGERYPAQSAATVR